VAEWGLSDGEKAAGSIRAKGGTDAQAKEAKDLADSIAALNKIGSIDKGDPLDTYAAKMEALNELLRAHKDLQDQITRAQKEAAKARDEALSADARAWKEKIQTPLEKYKKELQTISAEVAKGLLTREQRGLHWGPRRCCTDRAARQAVEHAGLQPVRVRCGDAVARGVAADGGGVAGARAAESVRWDNQRPPVQRHRWPPQPERHLRLHGDRIRCDDG
jgi:hypothetical protein